jgi:predicted dehydrogenase
MRTGLIGVGRIGAFHARTLRGLKEADSLIVTDADLARAREAGRQFGAGYDVRLEVLGSAAFYVAEAYELSRQRREPAAIAEVRR